MSNIQYCLKDEDLSIQCAERIGAMAFSGISLLEDGE